MRRFQTLLLALPALAVWALGPRAAEVPLPPAPTRWATDTAAFLSPVALAQADELLRAFEQRTQQQVLLYIAPTTGGTPTEDWTVKAFEKWRIGRKGLDDGLVLFVFAEDRKVRIEVGYGLEGRVPDATASRIIHEVITPRIQAGDRDGAILAGLRTLLGVLDPSAAPQDRADGSAQGVGPAGGPPSRTPAQFSLGQKILIGILIVGFIILFITNPGMALWLLFSLLSGGRGGGGGGGFSGGGGRSGGGGATGSW